MELGDRGPEALLAGGYCGLRSVPCPTAPRRRQASEAARVIKDCEGADLQVRHLPAPCRGLSRRAREVEPLFDGLCGRRVHVLPGPVPFEGGMQVRVAAAAVCQAALLDLKAASDGGEPGQGECLAGSPEQAPSWPGASPQPRAVRTGTATARRRSIGAPDVRGPRARLRRPPPAWCRTHYSLPGRSEPGVQCWFPMGRWYRSVDRRLGLRRWGWGRWRGLDRRPPLDSRRLEPLDRGELRALLLRYPSWPFATRPPSRGMRRTRKEPSSRGAPRPASLPLPRCARRRWWSSRWLRSPAGVTGSERGADGPPPERATGGRGSP